MEHLLVSVLPGLALKVVAFVFLIGVLVVIHEWGHYIMSKRAGVPVEEFSLGFGPVVARLGHRAETVFNLRALPLGGFVRTVGMEPGDDTPGGYNTKPVWSRAKIIAAGAIINLIFGFLVFVGLGLTYGLPSDDGLRVTVAGVNAKSPAERAGMKPGDIVVSVNGQSAKDPTGLKDMIQKHPGEKVNVVVDRNGQSVPLTAVPEAVKEGGETHGQLGFRMDVDYTWERHGFLASIADGAKQSWNLSSQILTHLTSAEMWRKKQFGGPIAIAQETGATVDRGIKYYLLFMAQFSVNLGVLNLLPLPVLDGGHLVLLAVEAIRRRRPSVKFVTAFQGVGIALLFLFFMYIMASDISRLAAGG